MSKENSSPGTYMFTCIATWLRWAVVSGSQPWEEQDTVFSAEEAARHRKTKVPGQASQMMKPVTQLLDLPTAWQQPLSRFSVYVRTQPEQSAAEEKWVKTVSDELPSNQFKNMVMGEKN